jgi:hypothetical protein
MELTIGNRYRLKGPVPEKAPIGRIVDITHSEIPGYDRIYLMWEVRPNVNDAYVQIYYSGEFETIFEPAPNVSRETFPELRAHTLTGSCATEYDYDRNIWVMAVNAKDAAKPFWIAVHVGGILSHYIKIEYVEELVPADYGLKPGTKSKYVLVNTFLINEFFGQDFDEDLNQSPSS